MAEIKEAFELSVPELSGYLVTDHFFPQFEGEDILISADYSLFNNDIDRTVFTVSSLNDILNKKIVTTKNVLTNKCDICGSSTDRKMKHIYSVSEHTVKYSIQKDTFLHAHHSPVVICDDCHSAVNTDLFVGLSNGFKLSRMV